MSTSGAGGGSGAAGGTRIADVYAILASDEAKATMLGTGSFGAVFKGVDVRTQAPLAIKVESRKAKHPQLMYEHAVLKELNERCRDLQERGLLQRAPGIPTVYWVGPFGDSCLALVMELLGPPVGASLGATGRSKEPAPLMDARTAAHVARCVLRSLRVIHGVGFVHRDIKPENLLWRRHPGTDPVFLIDFGLAKRLINVDGSHVPRSTTKALVGTPQYAALHAHLGDELSRRDDLESLVYVLVYLVKGSLPWQHVKEEPSNPMFEAMGAVKEGIRSAELIEGIEPALGAALQATLHVAYGTEFNQCPDYSALNTIWEGV